MNALGGDADTPDITLKAYMRAWQELKKLGRGWPEVMVGFGLALTLVWAAALFWLMAIMFA